MNQIFRAKISYVCFKIKKSKNYKNKDLCIYRIPHIQTSTPMTLREISEVGKCIENWRVLSLSGSKHQYNKHIQ